MLQGLSPSICSGQVAYGPLLLQHAAVIAYISCHSIYAIPAGVAPAQQYAAAGTSAAQPSSALSTHMRHMSITWVIAGHKYRLRLHGC